MTKSKVRWSNQDIVFLKENYTDLSFKKVCEYLKRSEDAVRQMATQLGLTKRKKYWTLSEIQYLAEKASSLSEEEIAKKLKKSIRGVHHKKQELKIKHTYFKNNSNMPIEKDVPFFDTKSGEYRLLLANMKVGDSIEYPSEENQTLTNAKKYFPNCYFRTKQVDKTTRRVWRLL